LWGLGLKTSQLGNRKTSRQGARGVRSEILDGEHCCAKIRNGPLTMRQDNGPGFYYGWIVVWAAFILLTISAGITYSIPVMFPFFETDFAIGRGQAAFIFSCSQVTAFVVGPVAGSLAEKLGPRVVVGGGLFLLTAGLVGAASANSYMQLVFWYGMPIGLGSGSIYVPLLGLIQRWFYKRRGLASGIATAGVSVGTLTFPVLSATVAGTFGWRPLYFGCALICLSIGLLAVCVLVADPNKRGLSPDGALDGSTPLPSEMIVSGLSLKEAVRDKQFYLLYFCSFGAAVMSFMAFVHLPQHVAEASREQMHAATIISAIGLSSFVARLGGGSWADHIGRIVMVRVALLLMPITCTLWVTNALGESIFFIVAVLFGISYGLCIALLPSVIADTFGNKEISRIIGAIYTSFALAALLGPTAAGLLRDTYGNYNLALGLCILLSASTVIVSGGIKRRY
jgi:OFA family oxalate/formate antiporter-like MFS transporter